MLILKLIFENYFSDRLNGTIASPTLLPENLLKDDLQLSESESDND